MLSLINKSVRRALGKNVHCINIPIKNKPEKYTEHLVDTPIRFKLENYTEQPVGCGIVVYYNKIKLGTKCMLDGYKPTIPEIRQTLERDYGLVEGKEGDLCYTIHNGGLPECDSIKVIKTECFCDREPESERMD